MSQVKRIGMSGFVGVVAMLTLASQPLAVRASSVFQTVNETLQPGAFFWANPSGTIGWYWTPASDLLLEGVQTRLRSGLSNLHNNYTFTTTLYTDRPAVGGTPLGSFTWSGVTPVDGVWLGGVFPGALSLTGGTTYFLGMSGWEQASAQYGPGGGSGVNWINPPDQAGAENLGAGSGYTGANFEIQMNVGPTPANIDSPVLRFIEVPEPATAALLALGLLSPSIRSRRRRT